VCSGSFFLEYCDYPITFVLLSLVVDVESKDGILKKKELAFRLPVSTTMADGQVPCRKRTTEQWNPVNGERM
jgi:hypothetical protein